MRGTVEYLDREEDSVSGANIYTYKTCSLSPQRLVLRYYDHGTISSF